MFSNRYTVAFSEKMLFLILQSETQVQSFNNQDIFAVRPKVNPICILSCGVVIVEDCRIKNSNYHRKMEANQDFLTFLSSEIPSPLRPISLFLTEAQKSLRYRIFYYLYIQFVLMNAVAEGLRMTPLASMPWHISALHSAQSTAPSRYGIYECKLVFVISSYQ